MKTRVIAFLFFGLSCFGLAEAKRIDTVGFHYLRTEEMKLCAIAPLINSAETDSARNASAGKLFLTLDTLLNIPGSYNYPFDSLRARTVSILRSSDNKFRIFTFNKVLLSGDYKNYGFLQMEGSENLIYPLIDTLKKPAKDFKNAELDTEEWYGALYYTLVPFKHRRKKMYLLLGYDGASIHSNKKVLDVLWFDKGTPVFGKEIFKERSFDKTASHRVVYEFHNESIMLMHYEQKRGIVVLDNLAPAFPEAVNDFYYYIPTGDYDYYHLTKKGYWVKDALENFNLGQGVQPAVPTTLPNPGDDPENHEDQD